MHLLFLSDSGVSPIVAGDAILRGEREREMVSCQVQVTTQPFVNCAEDSLIALIKSLSA